ncbi:MAG: hypothetical protein QFF03_17005 [Pseudomonadota bacterium]|nr:hypothetical protein [Pseudomonadota bacterium]
MALQHHTTRRLAPALRCAAMAAGFVCVALAQADDGAPQPSWSLSGFGSAGLAYSDHDGADYATSLLKGAGVGASGRWSGSVDSRLGAQLSVKAGAQWSAVLQVISEQRLDHTYRPIVEWANLQYQATPDLALRIGRIALPMFLAADYRKIGYAYPWARTPVEVYGAIPITNSDGIDATYRWHRGSLKNLTQVFFGRTDLRLPADGRIEVRRLAGFSDTLEYGAASARVSMLSSELTVDALRDVVDGLRQFGAAGAALAQYYALDHKRVDAIGIGASYDPGHWFAMAEMGRMRSHSFYGDTTSVYASGGYRVGHFTPYLAYARIHTNGGGAPHLELAGLPAAAAAAGAGMNAYLAALSTTIPVQRTISAGLRWDCLASAALKLQLDQVTPLDGSRGTFINVQPAFRSGRRVTVASAVLDFVF